MAASVLVAMLLSGLVLAPTVVMNSAFRDQMFNRSLKKSGLTITSESGSGGWLQSVRIQGIQIADKTGAVKAQIASIQTDKSILALWTNPNDLGRIIVDSLDIKLTLDEDGNLPEALRKLAGESDDSDSLKKDRPPPEVEFQIRDAAVALSIASRDLPIVEVNDIQISGNLAKNDQGEHWLTVDEIQLFDHESLTDLHTQQNLALIAPVLSMTTHLEGEFSLWVDAIHHQLTTDSDTKIRLAGHAALHSVQATLAQDWARQISQYVGKAMGRDTPARLEVIRDTQMDFLVIDDGIYHEGLAFLLPQSLGQTVVDSSGIVGFDESVDLDFQVQLPTPSFGGAFVASISKMLSKPFLIKVTGTVSDPQLNAPSGFGFIDQLSEHANPGSSLEPAPPIHNSVIDLIGISTGRSEDSAAEVTGSILNIIRRAKDAREAKKKASSTEPDSNQLSLKERREQRRKARQNREL